MSRKMRLAYFSPLPPIHSGISDYSAELLPHLAEHYSVTVFLSQKTLEMENPANIEVRKISEFKKAAKNNSFDLFLYHMGNGLDHEEIYRIALEHPGIVVLHDFVLHHFIAGITLDRGKRDTYIEELIYEYGEEGRDLGLRIVSPATSPQERFHIFMEHPLNKKLLDASLGVLCHSEFVRAMIHQQCPDARAYRVPMGIVLPEADSSAKAEAREALGLNPGEFLVSSFGRINPAKRIDKALRAFSRLKKEFHDCRYLLVGDKEPDYDVQALIGELSIEDSVTLVGFTTLDDFQRYIQASDVCVNLRYPTAGETSAGLLRILAAGRPVLVSDCGSFSEFPNDVALKVPVGDPAKEEELIYRYLHLLKTQPELKEKLGGNARSFAEHHHSLPHSAREYKESIERILLKDTYGAVETSQGVPSIGTNGRDLPSVHVIVLNYNGEKHIDVCLTSLLNQTYPNTHVIMVDNSSPDGSGEYAEKKYPQPQVESILLKDNLGFARGNNIGFERALELGADYVIALNNDVEVDKNWVLRQVEVMENNPEIGGCGSRILSYWQRDIINSLGHEMNQWGHTWDIGFGRRYDPERWGQPFEVISICGCSFMIRRNVLEQVKGFDPNYFAYYDDVDLSIRIKGLGYKLMYVPDAIVYHKFSASFGHESNWKLALCTANKWRFLWTHFPLRKIASVFPRQFKRDIREALRLIKLGDGKNAGVLLTASWLFAKMLPQLLTKRLVHRWPKQHFDFLNMCVPQNTVPHFWAPRQDYELLREGDPEVPGRIIMGYSDDYLGEGWFPVETGYYTEAFRWMSKKATVFLSTKDIPSDEHAYLQFHVCCPYAFLRVPQLKCSVNGSEVGHYSIGMDWKTVHIPLTGPLEPLIQIDFESDYLFVAEMTGELRDVTVKFDEISIVSEGSPFFRVCLDDGDSENDGGNCYSSVSPNQLLAKLKLEESPRGTLSPGQAFEVTVSAENIGDTCWVATPLSQGGYVTLGAQLLDASGQVITMDYGRQLLDNHVMPGEGLEISMPLAAPGTVGRYTLKLDLVDEGMVWFEQCGSEPIRFEMNVEEVIVSAG